MKPESPDLRLEADILEAANAVLASLRNSSSRELLAAELYTIGQHGPILFATDGSREFALAIERLELERIIAPAGNGAFKAFSPRVERALGRAVICWGAQLARAKGGLAA
jgi:hypothetical protein